MKRSATLEVLKYFEKEGVECFGNPYISFNDIPNDEIRFTFDTFGKFILTKVTNNRFFVQWFSSKQHVAIEEIIKDVFKLLEKIVSGNSAYLIS